jgi:hypothetical protein
MAPTQTIYFFYFFEENKTNLILTCSLALAKTWIYAGVKIVFLESTVNRLSADDSFLYNKTSLIEKDVKQAYMSVLMRHQNTGFS